MPSAFTGVQLVSNVLTRRSDLPDRVDEMWQILLPGIVCDELSGDIERLVKSRWTPAAA
jgi:hypothetical protein